MYYKIVAVEAVGSCCVLLRECYYALLCKQSARQGMGSRKEVTLVLRVTKLLTTGQKSTTPAVCTPDLPLTSNNHFLCMVPDELLDLDVCWSS